MANKMKYYVDKDDNVFALREGEDEFIKDGWKDIEERDALVIANPPPTQAELDKQKEAENIAFLSSETRRTNDAIEVLNDAIEFDIATEDEIKRHKELRKYRILLSRVPKRKAWPLKVTWPECPEFFKLN